MCRFLLITLLFICGCDSVQPQYETEDWLSQPSEEVRVVLVSEPWCSACSEQKEILQDLSDSGQISGFDVVDSKHSSYKARMLPTIYICCSHGCKKLEGLSSKQQILRAAQE